MLIFIALLIKLKPMNKNLELLQPHKAGKMKLTDGTVSNYGVIRTDNENLVHYTGTGLREMFKSNMTEEEKVIAEKLNAKSEEELIQSEHIAVTPFSTIEHVIK